MGETTTTTAVGSMGDVVSVLTTGVTSETIFSVVADVMPFVVQMIPIALGLYLLRKVVKGAGKAKVKF